MATVSNTLRLNDGMGTVIRSVITEMNSAIGTMERLDLTSRRMYLGDSFIEAMRSLPTMRNQLEQINSELRQAGQEQRNFNQRIRDGTTEANSLKNILQTMGIAYTGKELISMSDSITLLSARLSLIKGDMETVNSLQNKIFLSADNARGLYTDTAASVAKLALLAGDAFSNNDEIIRFVNLLQKMGTVGGSSTSEISNAMYQLNQAMAAGKLQGDEYRSIIENAPMLAQAIEDYMTNVQGAEGSMKDWAAEGLLTADVIKAAVFSVADEVDEAFGKMPMTWGAVWNAAINFLIKAGEPVLHFINLLANNWTIIEPIVIGAAIALGAYTLALIFYSVASRAASIATAVHTAFTSGWTFATFAATAAQEGLNAALMACPITWIILAIILLIAIFYAAIAAVNKFAGTSLSATGIIVGAFMMGLAFIGNLFVTFYNLVIDIFVEVWNFIAIFVEFFANVFNDPIGSVIRLFSGMADSILGVLEGIASAMDTLFGSHLADSVSGWRKDLQKMTDDVAGEAKIKVQRIDSTQFHLDRFNYGDAFKYGNNVGSSIEDKVKGLLGGDKGDFNIDDLTSALGDQDYDVNVKDDVNLAKESLSFLLDAVTQKYVNKVNVIAPAPQVAVQFTGEINRDVDLDAVAEATKKKIGQELVEYALTNTDVKRG